MTIQELIERTTYAGDAQRIADTLAKFNISEVNIPNLPTIVGMKVCGISTYKLQAELMEAISDPHIDVSKEPEVVDPLHPFDQFGARISIALQEAGFNTITDLEGKDADDLSQLHGIGRKSADAIVSVVNSKGETNGYQDN